MFIAKVINLYIKKIYSVTISLRNPMQKKKAFYVDLNTLNNQLVLKLMVHYEHNEFIKLTTLKKLIPFINKGEVDYLVIDENTQAKSLMTNKSQIEKTSMNTKLLWNGIREL